MNLSKGVLIMKPIEYYINKYYRFLEDENLDMIYNHNDCEVLAGEFLAGKWSALEDFDKFADKNDKLYEGAKAIIEEISKNYTEKELIDLAIIYKE